MPEPVRLTSRLLVDALRRRVQAEGGFATILQRGNDAAGALLIECRERGQFVQLLEKYTDFEGQSGWRTIDPPYVASAKWPENYGRRRAESDPDLWWIELDIADAAQFTAELTGKD